MLGGMFVKCEASEEGLGGWLHRVWVWHGLDPCALTLRCRCRAAMSPVASSGPRGLRGGAGATFAIDG